MYETERFFNRRFFTRGYMTTKAGTISLRHAVT